MSATRGWWQDGAWWRVGALAGVTGLGLAMSAQQLDGAPRNEDKLQLAALEKKVDKVLENQKTILDTLNVMLEELRVVKVRATR